ncbi:hypothetical protein C2I27_04310 [Priestia megaterium]|uniref:hypothetical protein n=1 Tax=Priestia megaterium TaxID=1404 RepID=UPI000D506D9A|nr:hypothetical protein [Priestia megaterium]PVC75115.1 hypothetical protein C2I27_04310 [Priestia megaterium]
MATVEQQRMMKGYVEREEMRLQYEQEKLKEVSIKANKRDIYSKEDMLNLPRHQMYAKCTDFVECPIDYKCRNFNSSYMKCQNCELHKTDSVCMKPHIHTEKALNMMISRERIDLDDERH